VFGFLKALVRGDLPAGSIVVAPDRLDALERRLGALEEGETTRAVQWAETRQALDRMLRRWAALQQREQPAEESNGRQTKEQLRATLRAKGYLREG